MDHIFEYWNWLLNVWINGQHIWSKVKNHGTFEVSFVIQIVYTKAMIEMKFMCAFVVEKFISKLNNHSLPHELMDAFGVVYP